MAVMVALPAMMMASACSTRVQAPALAPLPPVAVTPPPSKPPVVGVASWYGPGFNGEKTSSGEIYHQDELTAACKKFKLGTRVMVTNLENGRSAVVLINDHGPFVKGRTIDLSKRAAQMLGITRMGTARVRIDPLGSPKEAAASQKDMTYALQFGSFTQQGNAYAVLERVKGAYPDARIQETDAGSLKFYRVRAGSYTTREAAQAQAEHTAAPDLPVVIVSE
jgi:rare lipoprotein A